MQRWARSWHVITFVVVTGALVLQLVLVARGNSILDETEPPGLAARLVQFFSYFTILTNILVAWATGTLAFGRDRDTRLWRVLHINAVVGIVLTGLIHWFFLRPLLDLHGADYAADKLLHVVSPILVVVGWSAFGPRRRIGVADLAPSAIYPGLYMVWTVIHGELSGFWPYPFTNVDELGLGRVLVNGVGVVALLLALTAGMWWLDGRLQRSRPA